jgi:hypothetical protein
MIMSAITPHLSSAELEQGYRTATEPIAKSHFHALWLLSRGYDIDETAEILSFSTRWVRILINRLDACGARRRQRAGAFFEPSAILLGRRIRMLRTRLLDRVTDRDERIPTPLIMD